MIGVLLGVIFGALVGAAGAAAYLLQKHPWRWAWLLNKVRKRAHMVAVLIDRGIPGIATVVEIGKPVRFFGDERMWVFSPKAVVEIAPDGKTVVQKFDVTDRVYKIHGIPTVFFSLRDMRPLRLEGYTNEISPEEVGAIIDRYTAIRKAEAFASIKQVDLRILIILALGVLTLIVAAYTLYTLFQVMANVQEVKALVRTIASPGIVPAPAEGNAAVVVVK